MNSIHSQFSQYSDIIANYVTADSNKFAERFESLLTELNEYVTKMGISEKTKINELLLIQALVDYFQSVLILKEKHGIEHINAAKVVAHTSYYINKYKPIQLLEANKEILDINEKFCLKYVLDFLSSEDRGSILLRKNENPGLKAFSETLLYFIKNKFDRPLDLEMIILSFCAGEIYYEKNKDIGEQLLSKYSE